MITFEPVPDTVDDLRAWDLEHVDARTPPRLPFFPGGSRSALGAFFYELGGLRPRSTPGIWADRSLAPWRSL